MNIHTPTKQVLVKRALDPVAVTNATVNGITIDTQNANNAVGNGNSAGNADMFTRALVVFVGAPGAATTVALSLQDSPDGTTWTTVTGSTLATITASTTAIQTMSVDLSKRQRYLRVQVVGTGTAGTMTAVIALFNPRYAPVIQDASDVLI